MKLLNLTPHEVRVIRDDGREIAIPPCGTIARCVDRAELAEPLRRPEGEVPMSLVWEGPVVGLPEPAQEVLLVVSRIVAAANPHRADLRFPFGEVRDSDGRILGCRSLGRFMRGD